MFISFFFMKQKTSFKIEKLNGICLITYHYKNDDNLMLELVITNDKGKYKHIN